MVSLPPARAALCGRSRQKKTIHFERLRHFYVMPPSRSTRSKSPAPRAGSAVASPAAKPSALGIFFYVPNLIGYLRVVLAFVGYAYAVEATWKVTVTSYMASQLLDAADGYAARRLKQSSTFGAVLDMVTDRASTTCLCVVLARYYPDLVVILTALVTIDMFSHWFHMYASLLIHSRSHKTVTNPLLAFYYRKAPLFITCALTEMWYMSLFVLKFTKGPLVGGTPLVELVFYIASPVCLFKQVANLVQMYVACVSLAEHDIRGKK